MDILIESPDRTSMRRVAQVVAPAIAAATLLPFKRPAVNFLIVGIAVLASFSVEVLRGGQASRFQYAVCAGLCLTPFALLDAEWVLALDALAFALFTALASGGFSTWRDLRTLPFRFLRAFPQIPGSTITPLRSYIRTMAPKKARVALTSVLLAGLLVVIFGGLFITADRAFASLLKGILPDLELERLFVRTLVFCVAFVGTALLLVLAIEGEQPPEDAAHPPLLGPAEWRIGLGFLVLLFLSFVAFQMTLLAGGGDRVLSTAGLTYAEYAREGFFQLIAAGSLVLVLIAAVTFRRPSIDRSLQLLLGTLCILTILILVSALYRLTLYESAFGFTRPRLLAHAAILWLGALFLILIGSGVLRNYRRVPGIVVALTALSILTFNAINPDRMIAKLNVDRYERLGKLDQQHLDTLSVDAYPEIARLPEWIQQSWVENKLSASAREPRSSWMEANLSRSMALNWFREKSSVH